MSRVFIFCGHGKMQNGVFDTGCTYKHYTEAALMEKVTKSAVFYLRQCKLDVVTDVPKNGINMYDQVSKANNMGGNLFVSIHCDYSGAPKGTIPLYASDKGRKAALLMNKYVRQYTSLTTRGLCKRDDLYELNVTNMPAVIFECGSIKNDLETLTLEYDAIGFGIARGICAYLGVRFTAVQFQLIQKLSLLEKLIVKRKFKYDGKSTNVNFSKAANGDKKINCALFISWGLQRIHVLSYKQRIWLGNSIHGNGANSLKRRCKVMHPNKRWYNCDLHIGDIVGFQWGSSSKNLVHTMVLIGFDKHRPVWATCGASDIKAKDLSRKRTAYETKQIKTICRLT